MKKCRIVFLLSVLSLNAVRLDDLACPMSQPQTAMTPQYVAIRNIVTFFELSEIVRTLVSCFPEIFTAPAEIILESLQAAEFGMPLYNRKAELLEKFRRQDLNQRLEKYTSGTKVIDIFSQELIEYISILCNCYAIIIQTLYKENKITAEQKEILYSLLNSIKNLIII